MQEPPQPEWSRHTQWRQGHVLSGAAAAALGLSNAVDSDGTCVVAVSHDCDLANDNLAAESDVEVIVGRLVPGQNGNFSWGKAPRTLHLPMLRDGAPVTVELVATAKRLVPKSALAPYLPDAAFALDGIGLSVLRSWMASRYNRAAFPDVFVQRMSDTKLDVKLAKALEPEGGLISFVYFDLDGGQCIERPAGSPYELRIVLVFPPGADPEASADAADAVVEKVQDVCEKRLAGGKDILLKACFAISEDELPVSKARLLVHWRLEYMSFKGEDGQVGPPPL